MHKTSARIIAAATSIVQWTLTVILLTASWIEIPVRAGELMIWDDRPASRWDTAYPVGNGRLGAMPWGLFPEEKILVNEETIWTRSDSFGMPEDSHQHLDEVRRLEAAGDYAGADRYVGE